jgi:glyoxylase-like metal-dependent hydrolase (beta-lactamase superfamily II)
MPIKTSNFGPVTRFDLAQKIAGRGRYWTTAYLVDGVLVDTGCAHCSEDFVNLLADQPVSKIVNTHTHEDHIGANGALQRSRPEIEIFVHPRGLPIIEDPRGEQPLHPYRKVMWGWPTTSVAKPALNLDSIETEYNRFTVYHTPGHSQDHLCLYEPDKGWLFTGDLYVGGKDRALGASYNIWQIIESLKRINELEISTLFPGSARIPSQPHHAITTKIEHLEQLGEKVLELDARGFSVGRITKTLCGSPMLIEVLTLGHFSRPNLVRSYLRHSSQ